MALGVYRVEYGYFNVHYSYTFRFLDRTRFRIATDEGRGMVEETAGFGSPTESVSVLLGWHSSFCGDPMPVCELQEAGSL